MVLANKLNGSIVASQKYSDSKATLFTTMSLGLDMVKGLIGVLYKSILRLLHPKTKINSQPKGKSIYCSSNYRLLKIL